MAILGPTATGKSALALALAERFGGEIINCDSTAVYRGFDIGTDKVPPAERRGIPHHLIDIVEPTGDYTAAQYARDAAAAIRDIHARGRLPILVGGTGFYYRALTRGPLSGPGRDAELRARLEAIAARRGVERLHRMLRRVDPASADAHSAARPEAHGPRARGVLSDRPAADGALRRHGVADSGRRRARHRPAAPGGGDLRARDAARGRAVRARAARRNPDAARARIPETARPFGGLVYRQALEHLHGVRDEAATRALIAQENRRYARRQLIWFRKEPNLVWFDGPGESPATIAAGEPPARRTVEGGPTPQVCNS